EPARPQLGADAEAVPRDDRLGEGEPQAGPGDNRRAGRGVAAHVPGRVGRTGVRV
ncbi:MAG: hypothetical protein AVDCRST_MAG22-1539, partial [uncultured Rubrobacteraceae bacterium]